MPNTEYEIFYHFTEAGASASCFHKGLFPGIGKRAAKTGQGKPYIYLCKEKDLIPWYLGLPLDSPYLVELKLPKTFVAEHIIKGRGYGMSVRYDEYLCSAPIKPQCIKKPVPCPKPNASMCQGLALDALFDISSSIVEITRLFDRYQALGREEKQQMEKDMEEYYLYGWEHGAWYLDNLEKAGVYRHVDHCLLQQKLKEKGEDGDYTLCDEYDGNGLKLFEQLTRFDGPFLETRQKLKGCISRCFPWAAKISTGGCENTFR